MTTCMLYTFVCVQVQVQYEICSAIHNVQKVVQWSLIGMIKKCILEPFTKCVSVSDVVSALSIKKLKHFCN